MAASDKARQDILMMLPPVGTLVRLGIDNSNDVTRKGPLAAHSPDQVYVTGVIINKQSWETNPDNIMLFVNKSNVEFRVINIWQIRSIDSRPVMIPGFKREVKRFKVKGSTGSEYIVTQDGTEWRCSCVGFQFRKQCKHVTSLRGQNHETYNHI